MFYLSFYCWPAYFSDSNVECIGMHWMYVEISRILYCIILFCLGIVILAFLLGKLSIITYYYIKISRLLFGIYAEQKQEPFVWHQSDEMRVDSYQLNTIVEP